VDLEASLRRVVEDDVATWPTMPARLLHVLAPGLGADVEVAAGVADLATGEPARPGSRFRIASVTKPFVAAAALRLVEDGRLSLDATLDVLLAGEYDELLRSGGYDTASITLRHLLTHTSGIYDFAADAYDGPATEGFQRECRRDPGRRWTRYEQVEFAMRHGHPYGKPGEVWAYSDTGACLVGEVIERVTGRTMGAAFRDLIGYERLGLRHTWQETIEPEPLDLPPLSHQYEDGFDVADFDASVDLYGGGGLMSTCRDVGRFFRALLAGVVFHDPVTLATMTTTLVDVPLTSEAGWEEDPSTAAMYLFHREIGGETWWGHDGYWGTTALTCPASDVTIVTGHQRSNMPKAFDRLEIVARVFSMLRSSNASSPSVTPMSARLEPEGDRERLVPLLLEADESETVLRSYLHDGELYRIVAGGEEVGAVLLIPAGDALEIKNIALEERRRGDGLGRAAVEAIAAHARRSGFARLLVGTADVSLETIGFYRAVGFHDAGRIDGFFDAYPQPVVEGGAVAHDMVRFEMPLG
jgi:D-alanyl-D-alanine carboxypeptidase